MNLFRKYLLILSLLAYTSIFSQTERPKIGLVLSGGGAKGIAHVGVLKAMEKAGLTPDYISGTSVGSVIGGLYAMGYSADELEKLVTSVNWDNLLSNKIPYNKVAYEEKNYYGRYLLNFYLKGWEPQLPKGFIEGQALTQLFSDLTRTVQDIYSFDSLPIPFRCVAADIITGEAVVLNHGSLALSMRASMAIPSIFTPVHIDNHLFVDGGIVRNMPVQEVLDMGADIVIGVFVSSDLDPEEELNSAISILSQSIFIKSAFDTRDQLKLCDHVVTPNLSPFATGSFSSAQSILDSGIVAGEKSYVYFKNLADSLKQIGPLHKIDSLSNPTEYIFEEIKIFGAKSYSGEYIRNRLNVSPNKTISIQEIDKRIGILYGTLYFEKIWYEISKKDNKQVLNVYLIERPKKEIRFSFHYDSENKGGVVANFTLRNFLLKKSRFIFEADLATFPRLKIDYLKHLGSEKIYAVQAIGNYLKNELPTFDSIGQINSSFSQTTWNGGMRLQVTRFRNGAYGIEVFQSFINLKPKIAEDFLRLISSVSYSSTKISAYHRFNSFNDRYFPTRGLISEAKIFTSTNFKGNIELNNSTNVDKSELNSILQTTKIQGIDITFFPVIPINDRFQVILKTKMKLSTLEPDKFNFGEYDYLGGFNPIQQNSTEFYGVNLNEFMSSNYIYGRFTMQYNLKEKYFLQAHCNVLDSKELVSLLYSNAKTYDLSGKDTRVGIGATLGYSSPIGPVSFSMAKDIDRKNVRSTLVIGFYF